MLSNKGVCKKTKKCQPVAGDMPDLIQTEHVPSKGLARPQNKNKLNEKNKNTNKTMSLQRKEKCCQKWCLYKNKKVSACCWGHARSNPN